MKTLLMEDDCAPDAYKDFCDRFKEITGTTVGEFQSSAIDLSDDEALVYINNQYRLEYHADDPFYVLYEVSK